MAKIYRIAKGDGTTTTGTGVVSLATAYRTWVLLATATVAGAAATGVTFSSLDISGYRRFVLEVNMLHNSATAGGYLSLYANNDQVDANYHSNAIYCGYGTGVNRESDACSRIIVFNNLTADAVLCDVIIVRGIDGKMHALSKGRSSIPATVEIWDSAVSWSTSANITRLDIVSGVADAIDVGSTFRLWGVL